MPKRWASLFCVISVVGYIIRCLLWSGLVYGFGFVCVFSLVYFMREMSVCFGGCLFICLAQLYKGLVTKNRITGSIINKLPTALLGKLMHLKPERLGCNTKHMGSSGNSELYSLLLILKLKVKIQEGSCHAKNLIMLQTIDCYVRMGVFRYIQLQSTCSCEKGQKGAFQITSFVLFLMYF